MTVWWKVARRHARAAGCVSFSTFSYVPGTPVSGPLKVVKWLGMAFCGGEPSSVTVVGSEENNAALLLLMNMTYRHHRRSSHCSLRSTTHGKPQASNLIQ